MPSGIGYTIQVPIRTVDAQDVKDAFSYIYRYQEMVDFGRGVLEPNPMSKEEFIETQCIQFLISIYKNYMIEKAEKDAAITADSLANQRALEVVQWFDRLRVESLPSDPFNDFPVCQTSSYELFAGDTLDITLMANDPNNSPLTFTVENNDLFQHTLNGNVLTISTDKNKTGLGTIAFKAYNGTKYSPLSFHNLNVKPIYPNSSSVTMNVVKNTPYDFDFQGTDPKNRTLTYEIVLEPTHGTYTLNNNHIQYTPEHDFEGQDYMKFRLYNGLVYSQDYEILIEVL